MTDPTRPATGYPAAPPPPQNGTNNYYYSNHNPYYARPPHQPPRATFFRRFFAALLAVFIIFGTVLFIVWLILRPRVPSFTLTSLSLTSLNTTSTTSSTLISGAWDARFTVANPNHKLHVYYDEIEARVLYRSSLLAQNQLPPFDQATKSQSDVVANLVASSTYIDPGLVNRINDDRSKGTIEFNVQVLAIVRFKAGGWRARRRFLRVFCDDLPVRVSSKSSNGSLSGPPRRCAVGI